MRPRNVKALAGQGPKFCIFLQLSVINVRHLSHPRVYHLHARTREHVRICRARCVARPAIVLHAQSAAPRAFPRLSHRSPLTTSLGVHNGLVSPRWEATPVNTVSECASGGLPAVLTFFANIQRPVAGSSR